MQKHNQVKRQKPSDSLFFRIPVFLSVWPKPLCLCFLKSSLEPCAISLSQSHMSEPSQPQKAQNTLPASQGGEGPLGNTAGYHCRAAPHSRLEVSAVDTGVQLSARSSGTATPLQPLSDHMASASQGPTAVMYSKPLEGRSDRPYPVHPTAGVV